MSVLITGMLAASLLGVSDAPAKEFDLRTVSASDFVDSIGVHGQLYAYKNDVANFDDLPNARQLYEQILKPRLRDLGVRHMRMFLPPPHHEAKVKDLESIGMRVNLILDPRQVAKTVEEAKKVVKRLGSVVESVEGPNEIDTNNGPEWRGQLRDYVREMATEFRGDAQTRRLDILGPTLTGRTKGRPNFSVEPPDLSPYIDFGSIHMYDLPLDHEPNGYDARALRYRRGPSRDKPLIATETGYSTTTASGGVSERVQAKYLLRRLAQYKAQGIKRTYIFNIIDLSANKSITTANFGILRHDGTPKASYKAIQRLIEIVGEGGNSGDRLRFTATGSSNLKALAISAQGRDQILALWLNVPSTDRDREETVRLQFEDSYDGFEVYEPLDGERPVDRLPGGRSATVKVGDGLSLVRLRG